MGFMNRCVILQVEIGAALVFWTLAQVKNSGGHPYQECLD